jgi:hypothetical protein
VVPKIGHKKNVVETLGVYDLSDTNNREFESFFNESRPLGFFYKKWRNV